MLAIANTACSRPAAAEPVSMSLGILAARLADGWQIDEPGRRASGGVLSAVLGIARSVYLGDLAVIDSTSTTPSTVHARISTLTPLLFTGILRSHQLWSNAAIRTWTPLGACLLCQVHDESATECLISMPRTIGPGWQHHGVAGKHRLAPLGWPRTREPTPGGRGKKPPFIRSACTRSINTARRRRAARHQVVGDGGRPAGHPDR